MWREVRNIIQCEISEKGEKRVCYQRIIREGFEEKVTLEQKSELCHRGSMGKPRGKESQGARTASAEAIR